jgi:hypothetical protein
MNEDPLAPARGIFHDLLIGCLVWVIFFGTLGCIVARCGL